MTDCPACGAKGLMTSSSRPILLCSRYNGGCDREFPLDYMQFPEGYPVSVKCTSLVSGASCQRPAVFHEAINEVCFICWDMAGRGSGTTTLRLFGGPAPTAAAPTSAPQVSVPAYTTWQCPKCNRAGQLSLAQNTNALDCRVCGQRTAYAAVKQHNDAISAAKAHVAATSVTWGPNQRLTPPPGQVFVSIPDNLTPENGFTFGTPPATTRPTCYGCDRELSAYLDAPVLKSDDPDLCRSCRTPNKETAHAD